MLKLWKRSGGCFTGTFTLSREDGPKNDRTRGSDYVVLALIGTDGSLLYVHESREYVMHASFTLDLQQAARFTPDPAAQWLKEYQIYFPNMRMLEAEEGRLLFLKEDLKDPPPA